LGKKGRTMALTSTCGPQSGGGYEIFWQGDKNQSGSTSKNKTKEDDKRGGKKSHDEREAVRRKALERKIGL